MTTSLCSGSIKRREFALRFLSDTPDSVIEQAVGYANSLLTEQVTGMCFFPLSFTNDVLGTVPVKAVHLRADDESWKNFQSRGVSATPTLVQAMKMSTVRRRRPRELAAMWDKAHVG